MSTPWTGTTTDEREHYYWEGADDLHITELEDAQADFVSGILTMIGAAIAAVLVSL